MGVPTEGCGLSLRGFFRFSLSVSDLKGFNFPFSPFCGCGESQPFQPDVGSTVGPKAVPQTLFSCAAPPKERRLIPTTSLNYSRAVQCNFDGNLSCSSEGSCRDLGENQSPVPWPSWQKQV